MNTNVEVMGNRNSVIDFNLNEQFLNVKKIVIPSDYLFSKFEDVSVFEVFAKLSGSTAATYQQILNDALENGQLDTPLNSDLYKELTENLQSVSENLGDIKLDGYNFMNSVSNAKFTITLRCESFSLTKYFQEKGSILSVIRSLLIEYLNFSANVHRLSKLSTFQLEITESEEIHKHIYLKKDGTSLILASAFGFVKASPIDYLVGTEFYFSKGKDFTFFRNSQTNAILRNHGNLVETEIQTRDKILSDEELIAINDVTKHINDAVIEMYITKKGKIRIQNLSILENQITNGSENGFYINRSSKNYDKISIVTIRDPLTDELPNPKYLLLRNASEIHNFLNETSILPLIDGIILNENLYLPLFDVLGSKFDVDIIYYKNELEKSLETKFNSETLEIGDSEANQNQTKNPFSNIIEEKTKENDAHLERLKNIDLSTPTELQPNNQLTNNERNQVNNITEQLISSPNSSINTSSSVSSGIPSSSGDGKPKSAFDLLMDAALNQQANSEPQFESQPEQQQVQESEMASQQSQQSQQPEMDLGAFSQSVSNTQSPAPQIPQSPNTDEVLEKSIIEAVTQPTIEPQEIQTSIQEEVQISQTSSINIQGVDPSEYDDVLATKLITLPNITSDAYFVDSSNLAQITTPAELFFVTPTTDDLTNPNLKYVIPLAVTEEYEDKHYYMINSTNDFFLLPEDNDLNLFINLSYVDSSLKKKFLNRLINNSKKAFIIMQKEDIDLVEDVINKVEGVFIKDLTSNDEYKQIKRKVLTFEKKFLMDSLN